MNVNRVAGGARYYSLDAMRGIAALAVAAYHFGQATGLAFPFGFLAVDFFFLLSGFVIEVAYGSKLRRGLGVRAFLRIRIARLYPLYFAAVALGLAVTLLRVLAKQQTPGWELFVTALANTAFLPWPIEQRLFPLNPVLWSLFFELLVNALFAAVLFRLPTRQLFIISVIAGIALCSVALAAADFDLGSTFATFSGGAMRTIFSFVVGVVVARMNITRGAPNRMSIAALAVLTAVLFSPRWWAVPMQDLATVFMIFPLLLLAGVRWDLPVRWRATAEFLGRTSFALYAVHFPLVLVAGTLIARFDVSPVVSLPVFLALILILSYALDRWYDGPARSSLRRIILPPVPAAAATA